MQNLKDFAEQGGPTLLQTAKAFDRTFGKILTCNSNVA